MAQPLRRRILRNNSHIKYHTSSSIWCGIKSNFQALIEYSTWNMGNGSKINFWTDAWCGPPLEGQLPIPANLQTGLQSKVKDFVLNFQWNLPSSLITLFLDIVEIINQVHIPLYPRDNERR